MSSALDARRLLEESVPAAVVLLFWVVLSWFGRPPVETGLRYAGVAMVLLYVGVRGAALAESLSPPPLPEDPEDVLRENARVAVPAGAWFLAALLVYVVEGLWNLLGVPGAFTSPADSLAFVLTGAGVATVLLYAVAVGLARVRDAETSDAGPDEPAAGDD